MEDEKTKGPSVITIKSKGEDGKPVLVHIEKDQGPDQPGKVVKVEPIPPKKNS